MLSSYMEILISYQPISKMECHNSFEHCSLDQWRFSTPSLKLTAKARNKNRPFALKEKVHLPIFPRRATWMCFFPPGVKKEMTFQVDFGMNTATTGDPNIRTFIDLVSCLFKVHMLQYLETMHQRSLQTWWTKLTTCLIHHLCIDGRKGETINIAPFFRGKSPSNHHRFGVLGHLLKSWVPCWNKTNEQLIRHRISPPINLEIYMFITYIGKHTQYISIYFLKYMCNLLYHLWYYHW